MIDISQLTSLISAFRIETEKEIISLETVGKFLQDIADLLASVPSQNDFNILRYWKEKRDGLMTFLWNQVVLQW